MNLRLLKLFLAAFWLVVGVSILTYESLVQPLRAQIPIGEGISVGWLALAFTGYNLFRYWLEGSQRPQRREAAEGTNPLRRHHRDTDKRSEPAEPDPAFDFGPLRPPDRR